MSLCKYLDGENIKPSTNSEAKALIGTKVKYLCTKDIDTSGRGYFFPRYGTIVEVERRNIAMDVAGNFVVWMPDLIEMIKVE